MNFISPNMGPLNKRQLQQFLLKTCQIYMVNNLLQAVCSSRRSTNKKSLTTVI